MNYTAIAITAIICITILVLCHEPKILINSLVVTVESEYWGAKLAPMKMTQKDVEDWVKMKEK